MTAHSIAGPTLHLKLDVIVRPRDPQTTAGPTDPAREIGKRLALEVGLAAQCLCGDDCEVVVEREIAVL